MFKNMTVPKAGGAAATFIGAGFVLYFCIGEKDATFSLLALTGAVAGWLGGMLFAPLSPSEQKRFSVLAKIISGFVTGYLLSKLDPIVTDLLKVDNATGYAPIANEQFAKRLLITLSSFGIAMLTVFNFRAYWTERPKESATGSVAGTSAGTAAPGDEARRPGG